MQARQHEALILALRNTLGRMEAALSGLDEAIVWANSAGEVQWCNSAFDRLVNRDHLRVLGASLVDLVPLWRGNQPLSAREHPVGILLEGSGRVAGDYELRRADGFRALLDVRGKSVGFTLEDFALVMVFAPATARHETVATQRDEITRLEAANRELAERSAAAHLVLSTLRYDLRGAIEDERKYLLGAGSSVSKDRFDRFIRKVGELLDPVV